MDPVTHTEPKTGRNVDIGPGVVLRCWGTRGSIPTPGPETVRYGGNTTCFELRHRDQRLIWP